MTDRSNRGTLRSTITLIIPSYSDYILVVHAIRRVHETGEAGACELCFFFSSRRRHTRCSRDWSSDVCSSDLLSSEDNFQGVIDLIRQKAISWKEETLGAGYEETEIPAACRESARRWRERMIESLGEMDDHILSKYVHGEPVSAEEIKASLRRCAVSLKAVPVLCGAAFKNKGVQPLLDAVVDYLPSPMDVPPIEGVVPETEEKVTRRAADDEPFAALVFKIMTDAFVGQLAFLRVYSGSLRNGDSVYNPRRARR